MFKSAMTEGKITINNPSIWRPIYDIKDAVSAYIRAIQADLSISGVFNVTTGNYTVGQVGDFVKQEVEALTGEKIKLEIKNIQDFRNYKVTFERARTILGFTPQGSIRGIIHDLFSHKESFGDYSNISFFNMKVFEKLIF